MASANPVAVIRQNLEVMAPEFKSALPAHISVEKFTRVAMTAINNTPALQNADRKSLFGAIVRLAQDGLLPDGREAAIVMFKDKAQAMPMIAGVLKKIRQSGQVSKISAYVVHEKDEFVVRYGFDEDVTHIPPALDQPRGKAIGAYAVAVLKDGARLLEVMSLEEIEKVRKVSRASGNGPWVEWWGEMARKTFMRRLSKRLPMSTDLDDAFERDETMSRAPAGEVIAMREPMSRLDALEHQITDVEPSDNVDVEGVEEPAPDHVGSEFGLAPVAEMPTLAPDFTKRLKRCELKADFVKLEDEFAAASNSLDDDEYNALKVHIDAGHERFFATESAVS